MSFHTERLQEIMQEVDPQKHAAMLQDYYKNLKTRDLLGGAADFGTGIVDGGRLLVDRYNQAVTPGAQGIQRGIQGMLAKGGGMGARNAIRFAGSAPVLTALKVVPAIGAAGAALGVGDIILGGDSAGNKAMDAAAMTVGGVLGSVGGPLGAAAGAGAGKAVSDGVQFLFGGGKSAEQRKMEEALALLRSGGMV